MSFLGFLSRLVKDYREANAAKHIPLPTAATYQDVFEFVRLSARGYMSDVSAIEPNDLLVRKDRITPSDISYFADELEQRLGLRRIIPRSEWETVATFDDMTRLFLRYLSRRQAGV